MKSKLIFTQADYKKAEAKWAEQLESMKMDAISDATLFCQVVLLKALTMMDVDKDFLTELQKNQDIVSERIGDKGDDYSLETAIKELKELDIVVEGDWK